MHGKEGGKTGEGKGGEAEEEARERQGRDSGVSSDMGGKVVWLGGFGRMAVHYMHCLDKRHGSHAGSMGLCEEQQDLVQQPMRQLLAG